jgi:hypothetical protein
MSSDVAPIISACATAVYAVISVASLWLLSRQIRDARRFGAAPALYALLKELEEHMTAVRRLGEAGAENLGVHETISRSLEFFERIEHLRSAGVLPLDVLTRALGPVLEVQLADPRFQAVIQQDVRQHEEVLRLAQHLHRRDRSGWPGPELSSRPSIGAGPHPATLSGHQKSQRNQRVSVCAARSARC